jgi:hypothetical protein
LALIGAGVIVWVYQFEVKELEPMLVLAEVEGEP